MIIAPSILSADWSILEKEIALCQELGVTTLHIDVMDGHFVPQITFGSKFIKDIRKCSSLVFDVHLMISNPEQYVDAMIGAGADIVSFHIEASRYSYRLISYLRESHPNKKVGISLNPQTPPESIFSLLSHVDQVIVMSVEPGFGGQSFITDTWKKLDALQQERLTHDYNFKIVVDGGVNEQNAALLIHAGVDMLVMGSAFFGVEDKRKLINTVLPHPV